MDYISENLILLRSLQKRRKSPLLALIEHIPSEIRPVIKKSHKYEEIYAKVLDFISKNPSISLQVQVQLEQVDQVEQVEQVEQVIYDGLSAVRYTDGGSPHEVAVLDALKNLGITELPKCEQLVTVIDGVYYVVHPNGKQCFPDMRLVKVLNGYSKHLDVECKTGKNCISWNDGYPVDDALYIFTCKTNSNTIVFNGSDLRDEGHSIHEYLQEIKRNANQVAKEMSSRLETRFTHGLRNSITTQHRICEIVRDDAKTINMLEQFCSIRMETYERAISLFSGAGGDTLGMENAGVRVVGYVEKDGAASLTHSLNFPHSHRIGSDIREIPDNVFSGYRGKIDYLFGGFPCQSFSHAGKKKLDDPRGQLYLEFVRAAKLIAPKWIIGENVKGIMNRTREDGKSMADVVVEAFSEIGYEMCYQLVNSADFGIPQDRKRVIFIGRRHDVEAKNIVFTKLPETKLSHILEFSLDCAAKLEEKHSILTASIPPENWIVGHLGAMASGFPPTNLVKLLSMNTPNENITFKTRGKPTFGCAVDFGDLSRSLICTYAHMPRLFVPVAVGDNRYLRPYTLLECKRIQGFPDDFKFNCPVATAIKQLGNAVCPIIITTVINALK